ncbi:MAG: GAF domain-containing protein [Chloroflexi bacterium]|nr:GAF domain-containing protein [Chloroflexota bacterium]
MTEERKSQLRTGVVAAVVLLSGIIFLSLPFIALRWTQDPFTGILFDPNLVINDSGDTDWPAQQGTETAAYPDRLIAVDDLPVADVGELQIVLAEKNVGEGVSLTLIQPPPETGLQTRFDDPEWTKEVFLFEIDLTDLWNQFWFFYVTSWILLGIGAWVFWVRPYATVSQVFALLMTFSALVVGLLFDARTTHIFTRLWLFSLSLTCGFTVLLAAIFPYEGRLFTRYPQLKWIIMLPGLFVGLWAQIILYDAANPWAYVTGWRALFLLNGLGLLAAILIIGYWSARSPSPVVRQQSRIILVGGVAGYTPVIVYFMATSLGYNASWIPQAFFIPLIVLYPMAFSYTIVRYRLLDTDMVMRRGVTYLLLMGVLVGAFAVVVLSLTTVFGPIINLSNPILLAVFVVLVVIVFDPLRRRLQASIDEMFFKQPLGMDSLLRDYNRELTTAVTEDQVASMLFLYVRTGIPGAEPDLYLPNSEMSAYRSYYRANDLLLGVDTPLVNFMKKAHGSVDLAEERIWPTVFKQEKETVDIMDTAVVVPMYNEKELLGWLSLPLKEETHRFSQAELSYLATLADQSIIGFERASVVRSLEARVYEQDMLSQFSQALNFTIEQDDMLELVFITYERIFDLNDFTIYLCDPDTQQIYTAFCLEEGERYDEREGRQQIVTDDMIHDVIDNGQFKVAENEAGCTWIASPLNAISETVGVIYAYYRDPGVTLSPRRQQLFNILADQTAIALARIETNRQLQLRAQQLEIINEVTFSLATTMDLVILLELILDKAIELLDTEAGTFMVSDLDTGELEFRVARGPASEGLIGKRLPMGTGLAGTAAQTGQPIIVNEVHEDKRWFAQVEEDTAFQTRSILTVPLLRHNAVWGVVQLINKRNGGPFDEDEQNLLITFASQAVVAMENARLLAQTDEALRKSVNELSLLTQLDRDLNTTLDLNHVVNLALDRMLRICNGTAGAIVLVTENKEPSSIETRGYDDFFAPEMMTAEMGLVGKVIKSQEPSVCGNVHEEAGYVTANFATHSQMTLPLLSKQQLIGVVAIESDEMYAFDEDALESAVRVANHAAIAIANALLVKQVNAANQAKSEFVSMVSHELKTPMTSMHGYTDLLLSGMTGEVNDQQKGFLETIAANIRRMSQQIQDLTDISRIETDQLHVTLAPTSLVHVVNETLLMVQQLADEKEIRLHLQLPEDLPLVMADKERLVQVLTNLLSNACKYSPPRTDVDLHFEAKLFPNGQDETIQPMVLCSVQDHGYGISEIDVRKLFTKFFRSENPNIRQAKGTGLGLSITRGIVELHQGEIWVESQLEKGTSFYFTLPQATAVGL